MRTRRLIPSVGHTKWSWRHAHPYAGLADGIKQEALAYYREINIYQLSVSPPTPSYSRINHVSFVWLEQAFSMLNVRHL